MHILRKLALALLLASTWFASAHGADCEDSVFPLRLTNADNAPEENFGTAILLDRDRWLYLAPAHVIAHAHRIFIIRLVELRVVFVDPENDIALLEPKDPAAMKFWIGLLDREIRALTLAPGTPAAGDVLVCSYPLKSLTAERARIVSAEELQPSALDKRGFVRIDKEIFPGESGGAVLDSEHRLVGMVVTLLSQTRELVSPGVAIPVEKLQQAVARARAPVLEMGPPAPPTPGATSVAAP